MSTESHHEQYMTVLKEEKNGSLSFTSINLLNVDFIETENRQLVYYIDGQRYKQITKLQDIQTVLNEQNGFVSLDRTNLVNLRKIKDYNQELGNIYFSEKHQDHEPFATIAKIKQKLFSPLLERAIAKNTDKTITKVVHEKSNNSRYKLNTNNNE